MSDRSSGEGARRAGQRRRRRRGSTPAEAHGRTDGLRLRVRVRRRMPRSALQTLLLRPMLELRAALMRISDLRPRRPWVPLAVLLGGLWLAWPTLKPALPRLLGLGSVESASPPPEVITVFVEDPQRTIRALEIWRSKPGSLLVLQGRPSSQRDNQEYLQRQGQWPSDMRRIVRLEPGCDTVAQVGALATLLERMNRSGRLTMVTSPAHLARTLAVGRILLGPLGWRVEGVEAFTGDNRPESRLRTWRDQLRAHGMRLTGLSGSASDQQCP